MAETKTYGCGMPFGIGSLLAVCISVMINKSFWWALLHGIFGWFYVLYAFTVRYSETTHALKQLF